MFGDFCISNLGRPASTPSVVGFAVKEFTTDQEDFSFGSSDIAGVQAGDLLILAVTDDLSSSVTNPTGWTALYNDTGFDGTSAAGLWRKIATSSDVSVTINRTSLGTPCAIMAAIRGVAYDSFSQSAADTMTPPSETVGIGAVVIAHAQDSITIITAPSGWSTNFAEAASSDSNQSLTGMAIRLDLSGAISPPDFGGAGGAANFMRCATIALNAGS